MAHIVQAEATRICLKTAPRYGILRKLFAMMSLSRQRRTLKDLEDHLLRDIGVTREEADIESKRRVWDAPVHWR